MHTALSAGMTRPLTVAVSLLIFCCEPVDQQDRPPVVALVSPARALVDTRLTVTGDHFGIGGPRDGVFVGGEPLSVEVWSNTVIIARLDIEALGHRFLVVQTDGEMSAPIPIEVLPAEPPSN